MEERHISHIYVQIKTPNLLANTISLSGECSIYFCVLFQNYLMKTDHPFVPVSCVKEHSRSRAFEVALAA